MIKNLWCSRQRLMRISLDVNAIEVVASRSRGDETPLCLICSDVPCRRRERSDPTGPLLPIQTPGGPSRAAGRHPLAGRSLSDPIAARFVTVQRMVSPELLGREADTVRVQGVSR